MSLKIELRAVFIFFLMTGFVYSGQTDTATQVPANHTVEIKGFKFEPAELQVAVGDTVTWVNRDIVPHTATSLDKSWDSAGLDTGQAFSMRVTADTAVDYFCLFHPSMKASLVMNDQ